MAKQQGRQCVYGLPLQVVASIADVVGAVAVVYSAFRDFAIGTAGDVLVEAAHEPGKAAKPLAVASNANRVACNRLAPRAAGLLVDCAVVPHRAQADPALGNLRVRPSRCG